jgi:RNA polymerase sigma factor for flagellar operon FliA
MLDGLRENDALPRGLRRELRRVEQAIARLEQRLGRPPAEDELAAALGITLAEYQKILQNAQGRQVISFEDLNGEGGEDFLERHVADSKGDPSRILEDENLKKLLVQGIESLPEREKLMMALYYEQDLNLREIGEVLGVTESRVSQLHTQAVARLRTRIFGESGIKKKKAGKHG